MARNFEQFVKRVMDGSQAGPVAQLLRAALACAEPLYSSAVAARNALFDARLRKTHRLPRPVISIGNLTTGGTGKTPMVRWLASRLREDGAHVAVLSRGYKSASGEMGDEQIMLDRMLNATSQIPVVLKANPNRIAAAGEVLREHPQTDVFILDDGFQHRAVARDLDIVLLNATDPFGQGHVLPRGFLRESAAGLKRAGAVVITHADRVSPEQFGNIQKRVEDRNPSIPAYRALHAPIGLRSAGVSSADLPDHSLSELAAIRFFAFSGIGSPNLLNAQLEALGSAYAGHQWFADHHRYSRNELAEVCDRARAAKADVVVTTEKDWVKAQSLWPSLADALPVWRLDVAIQFVGDDEKRLMEQIKSAMREIHPRAQS